MSLAACTTLLLLAPQGQPSAPGQDLAAPAPMQPLPVPRALCVPRGDRKVLVDGSVVDWPGLPPLMLSDPRQLSGTAMGVWRGPDDLSAQAFLMWDAEDLYVACVVQDDWHRALREDTLRLTEIPVADSVVLTFDPERDTRSLGPDPGRREDREFWLAQLGEHGKDLVQWDRLRGTARVVDGGAQFVSHSREKGITTYEARIPWPEILPAGAEPKSGMVFDLQIVVNDFDEITDPMPQTRIGWTFGTGPRIDPGLHGSVMLVDEARPGDPMPEFPVAPAPREEPVPGPSYWKDFSASLAETGPEVHDGKQAPEQLGGVERWKLLERLEEHLERFPRVDFLQFHMRVHRRMQREVAGVVTRGLPFYWYEVLQGVSRRAEEAPPAGTFRLFRLPMGGWLVRSPEVNFLIDPAGPDVAHYLWGGAEFVILTEPLDISRRNDQLLVRMAANEDPRVFLTHAVFHLPLVRMADIPLASPGGEYEAPGGVKVEVIGRVMEDGSVPFSMSYRIIWPDGRTLLMAKQDLGSDELPEDGKATAVILSPRNPKAADLARELEPGLVVLDDLFRCQTMAGMPRVALPDAFELQREMLPAESIVLAPGEHVDCPAR